MTNCHDARMSVAIHGQLFLSPGQVKQLVTAIRVPYGSLVYVLAVAGLR